MDMGTTTMDMAATTAAMTATTTSAMDMATSTMDMATSAMDMASSVMDMGSSSMDMATTSMSGMVMTTSMAGMDMGTTTMSGMNMGGSTTTMAAMKMSCSMSMLWNWTTKDVCFLSDQWKTSTPALFGGTCVGVFALLATIVWWRRVLAEYKNAIANVRKREVAAVVQAGVDLTTTDEPFGALSQQGWLADVTIPLVNSLRHAWLRGPDANLAIAVGDKVYVYPSLLEHILYCVGDTMEWSVHHVIMLLYMYFNGYVFISSMIGAGVGWLLFNYKPLGNVNRGDVNRRCCL